MDLTAFGDKAKAWEETKNKFPPVINRLTRYEVAISQMSRESGVPLELLYHGSKGLASFRIEARVNARGKSPTEVQQGIEKAVNALKDAYYTMTLHQRRLADSWGRLPAGKLDGT
jgi:hypothetical protein